MLKNENDFEEYSTMDGVILRYEKTFTKGGHEIIDPVLKISLSGGNTFELSRDQLDEMSDYLMPRPDLSVNVEWDKIDTSLVKGYSDELLLEQIKHIRVNSGYGLIAEACKRLWEKSNANNKG